MKGRPDLVALLPAAQMCPSSRRGIVEALQVQAVEPVHVALQAGQVLPPAVHSGAGAVHPDGLENGLPELFHRLILRAAGKDLPGPGGDGDGADAPGDGIAHGQLPVLPEGLAAGALGAGNPVRIHAHQILRIPGGDMEEGRALAGVAVIELRLPGRETVKDAVLRMEVFLPRQLVVTPTHDHLPAAGGIGGPGAQPGEPRAVYRRADHQRLSLLDVDAYLYQQFCVFFKFRFHGGSFLCRAPRGRVSCFCSIARGLPRPGVRAAQARAQ